MDMDAANTFSSDIDLYANQCRDVSNMRTSLLSCNKNDPDSARRAIQYIPDLTYPVISEERYADLEDLDGEVWSLVTSYTRTDGVRFELQQGYVVSNMGRFKRVSHTQEYDRHGVHIVANIPERMLRRHADIDGYYRVCAQLAEEGNELLISLARLVATAFIGEIRNADEVDHLNKNRQDDRVCNLEIVTSAENKRRSSTTGHPGYFIEFPEFVFSSQKAACDAIGRDPTYISTCIHDGYALHPRWLPHVSLHWKECE